MALCNLCPRKCNIDRSIKKGYCGIKGVNIYCGYAGLHMWEEPCISGDKGSGAVFFSGCSLRCVYCQNYNISEGSWGKEITAERLADIFIELQNKGALNINLVTPTHYTLSIINSLDIAFNKGLNIPIVYNCSGYEKVETLKILENYVDIYLTDFKYMNSEIAFKYSKAKDYPDIAKKALAEMVRQKPKAEFDENGIMKKGVIVRNLLLPGYINNSKAVVKYVYETYGNNVYLSLMNQFTPLENVKDYKELNRRVTKREYNSLVNYAIELGVENAFIQEGETSKESFIPKFDFKGV